MSPADVASALTDRPADARMMGDRWFVCGEMGPKMYEHLRMRMFTDRSVRVSAFRSPYGGSYCVLTHQVADIQHRFLMPLYESRVAACLADARRSPMGFSLAYGESSALILELPAPVVKMLSPVENLCTELGDAELFEVLAEFPLVVASLTAPSQIPSFQPPWEVNEVNLSVLLPTESLDRADLEFDVEEMS